MKLDEWLNHGIPDIAASLEDMNRQYFFAEKTIGFAGKETIYRILHSFRSALFPGVYEKYPIDEARVRVTIGNQLRTSALDLRDLIAKVLNAKNDGMSGKPAEAASDGESRADEIVMRLVDRFPDIRQSIQTDIQAAYTGDPAAVSTEEILLSYPSVEAISIHRIAHELYKCGVPIIPRMMSEYAHQLTGIDIHPGASIGEYFFIDHGTGVVIGETCTIGAHVKLYQGVTLGARSFSLDEHGNPIKGIKRHPNIESHVVIYAGATILGGDTTIGSHSVIGGNVWLTQSVPPYSKVYNSPPSPKIKHENGL